MLHLLRNAMNAVRPMECTQYTSTNTERGKQKIYVWVYRLNFYWLDNLTIYFIKNNHLRFFWPHNFGLTIPCELHYWGCGHVKNNYPLQDNKSNRNKKGKRERERERERDKQPFCYQNLRKNLNFIIIVYLFWNNDLED